MNKKNLLLILLAVILTIIAGIAIIGIFYWNSSKPKEGTENSEENQKIIEDATKGILPSIENTNPLENKPDLNPVSKTNPYKDIKTNPFE